MKPAVIPLPNYEKRWLRDAAQFKIGMFARQTGKTFTTTLEIVDDCYENFTKGRQARWVILSRGERQAAEAMNEGIKRHANAYGAAFEAFEYDWRGEQGVYKALDVALPGGSRITALPANPDTARGYSANVFLDEFAIHRDSREIWGALFPIVSKKGLKLRVTSTPKGRNNKFAEIWLGQDTTWSRHKTTIYDAVADGLERDIEQLRKGLGDEQLWAQEYECEFIDDASAWLTHDQIAWAEHEGAGKRELYQGGPCYIGLDIGRRRDLFVIWVWEKIGDVLWTREVIARQGISFSEQDALLDDVMRFYKVSRGAMDQTGMGEKPVEDAQRRYGSMIEGVLMTPARQLAMATVARKRFEDRQVRTPAGDHDIRKDLRMIEKVAGATGAPRIITPRDAGGHADRAWAAFLGLAAADNGEISYRGYRGVERASSIFGHNGGPPLDDGQFRMRADQRSSNALFGKGTF